MQGLVLLEDARESAKDKLLVGQRLSEGDVEGVLAHVSRHPLYLFSLVVEHSLDVYL